MSKPPISTRLLFSNFSRAINQSLPLSRACTASCTKLLRSPSRQIQRPRISTLELNGLNSRQAFSTSAEKRAYKTVEEQRSRYRAGVCLPSRLNTRVRRHHSRSAAANNHPQPFSWKAGLLFVASGLGLIFYFRYEKARMERKRVAEATKGVGRPKVGGKFELVDQEGRPFTDEDLRGKYGLVS